jgi:hypothetical protein
MRAMNEYFGKRKRHLLMVTKVGDNIQNTLWKKEYDEIISGQAGRLQ